MTYVNLSIDLKQPFYYVMTHDVEFPIGSLLVEFGHVQVLHCSFVGQVMMSSEVQHVIVPVLVSDIHTELRIT